MTRARRASPVPLGGYTKENVIGYLQHLAKELGHTPSVPEIRAHGPPSSSTIAKVFGGTLTAAMEAAGLKPNRPGGNRGLPRRPRKREEKSVTQRRTALPSLDVLDTLTTYQQAGRK